MYEATAWLCAGWSTDRADAFARRSLVAHGIAQRAHPEVMAVVEWARSRHLPLYLVSASPGFVVRAAARLLGIGDFTILAMDPPVVGGHIGVGVVPPVTYGDGKVDALRGSVGAGVILAALGDNGFDVPMLQAARVGVAVRPKERLRSRAAEVPGLVVLSEG
jgi:phosphoserine phosphatase